MHYDITIDPKLYETYPEIRLGCLRFTAKVLPPDEAFWHYLDTEVFPQVRNDIAGKAWSEIPGIRGSRAAYKAFGRDPGRYRVSSESLIRRVRRGDDIVVRAERPCKQVAYRLFVVNYEYRSHISDCLAS